MRLGLVAVLMCAATPARAGRTLFAWSYGTEVQPERGVELMSSLYEEDGEARWWLGPLIGLTDRLELALPIELSRQTSTDIARGTASSATTALARYGAELRYRLVSPDPSPSLVPLVRVALYRVLDARDTVNPEADLVVAYNIGALQLLVDVGGAAELGAEDHWEARPGAGASLRVTSELRLGVEAHAELPTGGEHRWAVVGPDLAWARGRFWLAATYGIGVFGVARAPRVQWGIAF